MINMAKRGEAVIAEEIFSLNTDVDGYVTGFVALDCPETYSIIEQVTPALRWKDGTLQQQWHVVEHQLGVPGNEKERYEWRDVQVEV